MGILSSGVRAIGVLVQLAGQECFDTGKRRLDLRQRQLDVLVDVDQAVVDGYLFRKEDVVAVVADVLLDQDRSQRTQDVFVLLEVLLMRVVHPSLLPRGVPAPPAEPRSAPRTTPDSSAGRATRPHRRYVLGRTGCVAGPHCSTHTVPAAGEGRTGTRSQGPESGAQGYADA